MAQSQALELQEKKELVSRDEKTTPVRYFVPTTDIFETEDALTVVMEVPGVDKGAVDKAIAHLHGIKALADFGDLEPPLGWYIGHVLGLDLHDDYPLLQRLGVLYRMQ